MDPKSIDTMFQVHPYSCIDIRAKAAELALLVNELCPDSREKSLAITNIQTAVLFAEESQKLHL